MICSICHSKVVEKNRKQCAACRKQQQRVVPTNVPSAKLSPVNVPTLSPLEFEVDRDHEAKYPGYHRYGTIEDPTKCWEKVCVRCGGKFETRLALNRFCSMACKSEVMVVLASGPHPNYVKWNSNVVSL